MTISIILFLLFPLSSYSFSFYFTSPPTQCQPLTVQIKGDAVPPYSLFLFSRNHTDPFVSTYVQFNSTSYTLPSLNWDAGMQFIPMMNDATGVGAGGMT